MVLLEPVMSYPVIMEIDDDDEDARCLQFSIPEDEDAHVVILALPEEDLLGSSADAMEAWYVNQLYKMTKIKSQHQDNILPKKLPDEAPDVVAKGMSAFLMEKHGGGNDVPLKVTVTMKSYDQEETNHDYHVKYFVPLVLNNIRDDHAKNEDEDYEDVKICLENTSDNEEDDGSHGLQVLFDFILVSEEVSDLDAQSDETGFAKDKHLTPLETSLDKSIDSGRQVLKEMKFMEQREKRMRETADGINARVHYFSYISVAILFGVTYIQVGYLKRYFKKKKLM